jgi:hypothetical protein
VGPHQEGEPSHLLFSLKVLFKGLYFFLPLLKNDFFQLDEMPTFINPEPVLLHLPTFAYI